LDKLQCIIELLGIQEPLNRSKIRHGKFRCRLVQLGFIHDKDSYTS